MKRWSFMSSILVENSIHVPPLPNQILSIHFVSNRSNSFQLKFIFSTFIPENSRENIQCGSKIWVISCFLRRRRNGLPVIERGCCLRINFQILNSRQFQNNTGEMNKSKVWGLNKIRENQNPWRMVIVFRKAKKLIETRKKKQSLRGQGSKLRKQMNRIGSPGPADDKLQKSQVKSESQDGYQQENGQNALSPKRKVSALQFLEPNQLWPHLLNSSTAWKCTVYLKAPAQGGAGNHLTGEEMGVPRQAV